MRNEIEKVLEAMKEDYRRWAVHFECTDDASKARKEEMIANYENGLKVEENRRYWKITGTSGGGTSESVKGFVVKAGDKKFKEGDLLKPAGWAAPARNFPRGNVLHGWLYQNVRWTGIG